MYLYMHRQAKVLIGKRLLCVVPFSFVLYHNPLFERLFVSRLHIGPVVHQPIKSEVRVEYSL